MEEDTEDDEEKLTLAPPWFQPGKRLAHARCPLKDGEDEAPRLIGVSR